MRKVVVFLAVTLVAGFLHTQSAAGQQHPEIHFEKTVYDFGAIPDDGGKVSHQFEFTNVGSAPMVLAHASSSCSCVDTDYPKTPIQPGDKGKIKVTYNPKKQQGMFHKAIQVHSNALSARVVVLYIKGTVEAEE